MKSIKKSGIYKITNIINNKLYIGKSINLFQRKSQHFSKLRKNEHKNFKLQGSVNKYGIDNFKFEVLEYCTNIDDKEIEYIHKYNSCKFIKLPISLGNSFIELLCKYNLFKFIKLPISLGNSFIWFLYKDNSRKFIKLPISFGNFFI